MRPITTTVMTLLVLLPFAVASAEQAPAVKPFTSFAELAVAIDRAAETGDAEPLWQRVTAAGAVPLVFGRTVVFLYRGPASTVEWRGDLDGWGEGLASHGERIGATDVWWKVAHLAPDARLDYKIVVDGSTWLLDPRNPHSQLGGYGPNSELRMPEWQPPEIAVRRDDGPRGSLGERTPFSSVKLGYVVHYRLYTPAGYDRDAEDAGPYPLLVVSDGSDYWHDDMGALVIILDNLIADGRLPPLVALFVDPWDRVAGVNRRESELVPEGPGVSPYLGFLCDELLPAITEGNPVDRSGAHTAILGTSLGGLFATYAAITRPDRFQLAAIQSPAYWPAQWVLPAISTADTLPRRVFIDVGLYERDFVGLSRRARDLFEQRGTKVLHREVPDGHSWGHWKATIAEGLEYLFSDDSEQ